MPETDTFTYTVSRRFLDKLFSIMAELADAADSKSYKTTIKSIDWEGLDGNCIQNKTRRIEFGRFAEENRRRGGEGKPETFDFLGGFTHISGKGRPGRFTVRRKTIRKFVRVRAGYHVKWYPKRDLMDYKSRPQEDGGKSMCGIA